LTSELSQFFHFSCAMKGAKATGGTRHGDHQERQPRAIRNRVHRMQRFTDCTERLVARRGAGSLSFLVLRKLRSHLVGGCDRQCSKTRRVGAATIFNFIFCGMRRLLMNRYLFDPVDSRAPPLLGSRFIKSTIQERPRGRQRQHGGGVANIGHEQRPASN
jgi:hypothetical protein